VQTEPELAAAVTELRRKADQHEQETLPALRDVSQYETALDQVASTFDRLEEELEETMPDPSVDNGHGWLLGDDFSAVDASLAVAANRLAQLGLQRLWLDCEAPRSRLAKHLASAQKRESFTRAVAEIGYADGRPPISLSDDGVGDKKQPALQSVSG